MRLPTVLSFLLCVCFCASSGSAEELDKRAFSAAKKELKRAVADVDLARVRAALDQLVEDQSLRALELFLKHGAESDEPQLRSLCVAAATRIEAPEALREAGEMLLDKRADSEERVLLCEALSTMRHREALDALIGALEADDAAVQRAALFALRDRQEQDALLAIYHLLEREEERGGQLFHLAWDIVQAREEAELPAFEPTVMRDRPPPPELFGTEIASHRVVFVLDISESMRDVDASEPGPPEPLDERSRQLLERFGVPDAPPTRMRIDRAKHELMRAVALLDDEAKFSVVAFHGVVRRLPTGQHVKESPERWLFPWHTELVAATPRNKSKAIGFVRELQANGATYTLSALELAFAMVDADTFCLLSDGIPTEPDEAGNKIPSEQILEQLTHINRTRKVVIHTFGFSGKGIPGVSRGVERGFEEFMQEIAAQHGGEYTPID